MQARLKSNETGIYLTIKDVKFFIRYIYSNIISVFVFFSSLSLPLILYMVYRNLWLRGGVNGLAIVYKDT